MPGAAAEQPGLPGRDPAPVRERDADALLRPHGPGPRRAAAVQALLGGDRKDPAIRQVRRAVEVVPILEEISRYDPLGEHDVETSIAAPAADRTRRLPARRVIFFRTREANGNNPKVFLSDQAVDLTPAADRLAAGSC